MLTIREKEKREQMEARIKKLKYRLYQAEIQFVSHDDERLLETMKKIRVGSRKVTELITGKKLKTVKSIQPRRATRISI